MIGGGVTGIQAALDLGDMGLRMHLVEKRPIIGGWMAQLDKTFPTNDCSLCILAPKMAECSWHPKVEVRTHTEVERVEGSMANFKVQLRGKSQYVRADRCNSIAKYAVELYGWHIHAWNQNRAKGKVCLCLPNDRKDSKMQRNLGLKQRNQAMS